MCVLDKDVGHRLPLKLQQYIVPHGKQGDVNQSVNGSYKKSHRWGGKYLTAAAVEYISLSCMCVVPYYYKKKHTPPAVRSNILSNSSLQAVCDDTPIARITGCVSSLRF